MCILEWIAAFLYVGYLILCYIDTFLKCSVHSCLPDIITYYCVGRILILASESTSMLRGSH